MSPSSLSTIRNPSNANKATFSSSTNLDNTSDFLSFSASVLSFLSDSTGKHNFLMFGTKNLEKKSHNRAENLNRNFSLKSCRQLELTQLEHVADFKIRNGQTHDGSFVEMI